ncbi:MAG: hypothetical protein PHX20_07790, partial [Candidatus Omnitrophica bacterium]|nr:hypothetical protein [Candidatus Omnitrophota bacterium]
MRTEKGFGNREISGKRFVEVEIDGKMRLLAATPELERLNSHAIASGLGLLALARLDASKVGEIFHVGNKDIGVTDSLRDAARTEMKRVINEESLIRIACTNAGERIDIEAGDTVVNIEVTDGLRTSAKATVEMRIRLGDKGIVSPYLSALDAMIEGRFARELSSPDAMVRQGAMDSIIKEMAQARTELGLNLPRDIRQAIDDVIRRDNPSLFDRNGNFTGAKGELQLLRYAFIYGIDSAKARALVAAIAEKGAIIRTHIGLTSQESADKGNEGVRATTLDTAPPEAKEICRIINDFLETIESNRDAKKKADTKSTSTDREFKIAHEQAKQLCDILSSPNLLIKMLTGGGKTTVIGPAFSALALALYKKGDNPLIERVVSITMNKPRSADAFDETCIALGAPIQTKPIGSTSFRYAEVDIGNTHIKIFEMYGADLKAVKGDPAMMADLIKELKGSDILMTDLSTLKEIKMDVEHKDAVAAEIMDLMTSKGWAIYDEAHTLPFAPHLIMGGNEKTLLDLARDGKGGDKMIASLEHVDRFVEKLYTDWITSEGKTDQNTVAFNRTFSEFIQHVRSTMMDKTAGGRFELSANRFNEEFLQWAQKENLVAKGMSLENFAKSTLEEHSFLRAALKGFEDALNMPHEGGDGGFGWGVDEKGEGRICPINDGKADTNMFWSAWNVAGARDLIGRRYMNKLEEVGGARKALELVKTSGDSIEVTDLDILSQFMARTMMTATPELLKYYGALQSVREGDFGTAFGRYLPRSPANLTPGYLNVLLKGEAWTASLDVLMTRVGKESSAGGHVTIDRLYVLAQQAGVNRGDMVAAAVTRAERAGVETWVQEADNYFQLYKDGAKVDGERYQIGATDGKDFKKVLNERMSIEDSAGRTYKGIVLLDQSGCTGLNLESAIFIPLKVRTAGKAINQLVIDGKLSKDVLDNGGITQAMVDAERGSDGKLTTLGELFETYLGYKEKSGPTWIGIFDENSTTTVVDQTMGRDRGIGAQGAFGFHKKEAWVIDSTKTGVAEEMAVDTFIGRIYATQKAFLKISLVNSITDNMKSALVDRLAMLGKIASTPEERAVVEKIRTRFQSRSGVDDRLNTTDARGALPEIKEAVERSLAGVMGNFIEAIRTHRGELKGDMRRIAEFYVSEDMKQLSLDPRTGQLELRLNLEGDVATEEAAIAGIIMPLSRLTPAELIRTISKTFAENGIMKETVATFGESAKREARLGRAEKGVEDVAPGSGVASRDVEAKLTECDKAGSSRERATTWANFVLGALTGARAAATNDE